MKLRLLLASIAAVAPIGASVGSALEQSHSGCMQMGAQALVLIERDDRGLARVVLPPLSPNEVALERPFSIWLPHLDFEPFPSPAATFPAHTVPTRLGQLQHCTLLDAWTASKYRERAGVIHVSFNPAATGEPRYPYHPAIPAAKAAGILSPAQIELIASADSEVARNHQQLLKELKDFARSAHDVATQQRFIASLRQVTRLRSLHEPRLAVTKFLDRNQREKVRAGGIEIDGSCRLLMTERQVRVELSACPWQQLAQTWERLGNIHRSAQAHRLRVKDSHRFLEAPDLSLSVSLTVSDDAYEIAGGILSGLPGLEALD